MKQLVVLFFLLTISFAASAQFPLGSNVKRIKAYFDNNISYISAQEFKTPDGVNAICFRKSKEVGDYVFYFDADGKCFNYVVTYDIKELPELMVRFDKKFVRIHSSRWTAPDNTFDVTLVPQKPGNNYFSIVYGPMGAGNSATNTIASN